jgi:ankyrin repeat protein
VIQRISVVLVVIGVFISASLCQKDSSSLNEQLLEAVIHGNKELVKSLLEQGADPNERGTSVMSSLTHAAYCEDIPGYPAEAIIKLLLSKGARVNEQDGYGKTALHRAVGHGNIPLAKLFSR